MIAPLAAMAEYSQWMNWKEVPRPDRPKPDKVPTNTAGENVNPHDPIYHLTYEQASSNGLPLAFVFTDSDPFFFIDLDKCLLPDQTWSPFALDMCQRFAGAAVEVSHSGNGLHIFGITADARKGHKNKNDKLGLEIYTTRRFVAIGTGQKGDAGTDHTAAFQTALTEFLPGKKLDLSGVNWTTAPVVEWSGPTDDAELIQLMLNARPSAAATFGSKATFTQLWTADAAALRDIFPDDTGAHSDGFDHNGPDMALIMHLAFWTGKDCERMKRLFEQSALVRDKWHKRPDYQVRTITTATSLSSAVYQRQDMNAAPAGVTPAATFTPQPIVRQGYQFLTVEGCAAHFAGCVYVRDIHRVFTPDGGLLAPDQFKATYGGYEFAISLDNGKPIKDAWEAFTQHKTITFPRVHRTAFRPEIPSGSIVHEEGLSLVNVYVPADIKETNDDVTPFLTHVAKLLPDERDREIIISYMAAIKQYPGSKFQWAPVIQGTPGNGKSLFMRVIAKAIGERYTHLPNAKELKEGGGKFTAWIENKLFIGVEEIHVRGRLEVAEVLTALLTNDRIEIQGKGSNQVTGDNRANFMFCSNHLDAVIKTANDRRYCIFYTAQQSKSDVMRDGMLGQVGTAEANYFPDLYNWLRSGGYAAVAGYLRRYEISPALNPAIEFGGQCQWAPDTSSTTAAIRETLGPIEQSIEEAIAEGRPGFLGDWISSIQLDKFLKDTGKSRALPSNKRQAMLESIGYIKHPALVAGRTSRAIPQEEQRKPVLYVRAGSIAHLNLVTNEQVITVYMKAQGWIIEEQGQVAQG